MLSSQATEQSIEEKSMQKALVKAIENNKLEQATLLLEAGAKLPTDLFLLHTVIKFNNRKMVALLLAHGADFEKESESHENLTPIRYAFQLGYIGCLREFFKIKAVVNTKSTGIVINDLAYKNESGLIKECIDAGIDLHQCYTDTLNNSLHIAVKKKDKHVFSLLLSHGVNIHQPNKEGETPLDLITKNGYWDFMAIYAKQAKSSKDALEKKSISSSAPAEREELFEKLIKGDKSTFSESQLSEIARRPRFKEDLFDYICRLDKQRQYNILFLSTTLPDNLIYKIWHVKRGNLNPISNVGMLGRAEWQRAFLERSGCYFENQETSAPAVLVTPTAPPLSQGEPARIIEQPAQVVNETREQTVLLYPEVVPGISNASFAAEVPTQVPATESLPSVQSDGNRLFAIKTEKPAESDVQTKPQQALVLG